MAASKFHVDYWSKRIVLREYVSADGSKRAIDEWQAYIQHDGRREWFQLGSANKTVAAKKALEIFTSLRAKGWPETLAKFKNKAVPKAADPTIGEFFKAVRDVADVAPPTLAGYLTRFRRIAADVNGLQPTKHRHDHVNGGSTAWRAKVEALKLSTLTPDAVEKWRRSFVARFAGDPERELHSKRTANTCIRNARSLFAPELLRRIQGVSLPTPHPFEGVQLFNPGSMQYHSSIGDIAALVVKARDELAVQDPEQFKAFILCLLCGLRRNEVDKLVWSSVLPAQKVIRIETTKYFKPKTPTSAADIPVEPELMQVLEGYRSKATGEFVIESTIPPKTAAAYPHYRANPVFKKLVDWLKANGVDASKPIHTLRKEFGKRITERHGIFAASRMLRHSNIAITAAHYADDQRHLTPGLGSVLDGGVTASSDAAPKQTPPRNTKQKTQSD